MPTSQLLPPEIVLDSSDYSINPVTATDGFMGDFHLHTRFGDYDCCGREMLFVRLEEFGAQERIDKVSKTGAFEQAITQGAVADQGRTWTGLTQRLRPRFGPLRRLFHGYGHTG